MLDGAGFGARMEARGMSGFENYDESTRAIEREIERKGLILGIDWADAVQVRTLAREAIDHAADGDTVGLAEGRHRKQGTDGVAGDAVCSGCGAGGTA